jgi:hypothetical protein
MEVATMSTGTRVVTGPSTDIAIAGRTPRALPTALVKGTGLAQIRAGTRSVVPYAEFVAHRLGRAGIVGVALLVFGAVGFASTNAALRDQISADAATLERLSSNTGPAIAPTTPQARYDEFVNGLPSRDDVPALMQQIVTVAANQGLSLEEGKYEIVTSGNADRLARYRMSFPVTGRYPQVRALIEGALLAVPAMSLDGLRVTRKDVGVGVVAAELDFVVFVRASK